MTNALPPARSPRSRRSLPLLGALCLALSAAPASAGGTPEAAVLIVDPGNAESMYIANYYKSARNIPDSNVFYMEPGAANYTAFGSANLPALFGSLENHCIEDHVDYVIIPPGGSFYVPASGYISDGCSPVNRFSIASCYTLAFIEDDILGGLPLSHPNHFQKPTWQARGFDSRVTWLNGDPSDSPNARRYFIGAMLGYTGERGNTPSEIIAMIDRSVAVDGTQPLGTFHYMETTDAARSAPRHGSYPTAVNRMATAGGQALHLFDVLPIAQGPSLGIMTGWASPDIDGANMVIEPGAFCDHLTSFAGRFDTSSQTKMSRWIAKGASGTSGTVEEPCNYSGKLPHARMHVMYFKGASLGEAWLRGIAYAPFQQLLYGDPLTSPFTFFPFLAVPDAPVGPQSGVVTITPSGAGTAPGAEIEFFELLVDGVRAQTIAQGQAFALDTTRLADGWHDLRILAYDDTFQRNIGRWVGTIEVANGSTSVTLSGLPASGDLAQAFDFTVAATGATVDEIRLLQAGRVVAATTSASDTLSVFGQNLGAGPVTVQAEARFTDGTVARSAPVDLDISFAGAPGSATPVAFGYTKYVLQNEPFVLELPAAYDDDPSAAVYTLVSPPTSATVLSTTDGPYRILSPSGTVGQETLTFEVSTSGGTSSVATVEIVYGVLPACSAPLGNTYCAPVANSTGSTGRMTVSGSETVEEDDLVLTATRLPTGPNIGYFIMGTGMNTFVPPGSAGPICITPGLLRYLPPVSNTTELDGGFQRDVGTTGAISGNITPGSTWNFQAWHRDGMNPSNLTDAVSVTFRP